MNEYNNEELTIILAMYFFDSGKMDSQLLNSLTRKFNLVFNRDINPQTLSYEISTFKNVDPSFNSNKIDVDSSYYSLWKYYIESDRIKDLQKIYKSFKKEEYIYNNKSDNGEVGDLQETSVEYSAISSVDYDSIVINALNNSFDQYVSNSFDDVPKEKYDDYNYNNIRKKRSLQVMMNALSNSGFCCEFSSNHHSFIRKKCNIPYTEGHHLIPLKYQERFEYNLDVESNIVSLCSECHNRIHYGKNSEEIIKKLYNDRKERLRKCNIEISIDELIKMYE